MIRTCLAAGLWLAAMSAPAFAQLPPDVQEMIDKVHIIAEGGRLAAVEEVSAVFERLPSGDLRHKPSGYVCAHTPATIQNGMMPGFVTIFDTPTTGHDIGCGMIGREINSTVFVFRSDKDMAGIVAQESQPARRDSPPQAGAPEPPVPTAADFGLPASTTFAADTWVDQQGRVQGIYLAKTGSWFVHVRVTYSPSAAATVREHAKLRFTEAMAQISG
jgi:hypothetical protein